ncbi:DUF402 domain-containing protein [Streptomyces sp. NPDC090029]|uniref:DUF402 domain-containing protein n=1 Tax=Streptomyces sp. NPDC090029 TaxID=3365924 RepID=UPI003810405B
MHVDPGTTLNWCFTLGGSLSTVCPVRVVESREEGLLLWLAPGSPLWKAKLPDGSHLRDLPPEDRPEGGYPLRPDRWQRGGALIYQPHGANHAVWWLFSPDQAFLGWYANLERRTRQGRDIHVIDHELDISVAVDRTWEWKDEDSFADKIGHPSYWTAEEAAQIRAEGLRVVEQAETGAFPFDSSWCDFQPSSSWSSPRLPPRPEPVGR